MKRNIPLLFLGAVYVYVLFAQNKELFAQFDPSPKSPSHLNPRPTEQANGSNRGFHAIHVYSSIPPIDRKKFSQVGQDLIILKLIQANDKKISAPTKNKFFVDLAANHAFKLSNSYMLEKKGWSGICIEGNPVYWYELAAYRKCTIIGAFVGGVEDGTEVDVVLSNGVYGGIVGKEMDNKMKAGEAKRNLVSISTVFEEASVPSVIDYLSLDVEGAESIVMANFPWQEYKLRFITIERPKDDLKEWLGTNGYTYVSDISAFRETLWYHEASVDLTLEEIRSLVAQSGYGHPTTKTLSI